jgi:hypothetical protein
MIRVSFGQIIGGTRQKEYGGLQRLYLVDYRLVEAIGYEAVASTVHMNQQTSVVPGAAIDVHISNGLLE